MGDYTPDRLRWPHFLLAVLFYFVLLLAWAPASLLAWALPKLTQQAVWLEQARGSVWRGEAAGVQVQTAAGEKLQLGRASWRFKPLDLFAGRLGYRLQLAGVGIAAQGVLRAGMQGIELRNVRAELPATLLGQVSPDLGLWQPGGRLVLETGSLAFGRAGVDGQATILWLDAASGRVRRPLGNYHANLEGAEDELKFRLSTETGPLFLQGAGNWNRQRGMVFNGTARAAPENRAELDGLLTLIGPAQPNGERVFRMGH